MISIRNLKKSFGSSVILENVNLEVEKGEAVVIIGGSGCGKSTLLRCINRLNIPDCGEVLIDGRDIHAKNADVDTIRKSMGMVYQQFNLFSHLNVLENIILAPMNVLGVDQETAIREAEELLEQVGMLRYKYNMPDTLSGGQKQRVAIARALAMHPEVMLFDEPTSALDPTMVDEVENVIRKLVDQGMTSIIVTHEMRFAKSIASKVVFLAEKGIYEMGTAEAVFEHPKKKLTRQFIFRSRMYEQSFTKEDFDPFVMRRNMKELVSRYDHTAGQIRFFSVVADELIYPLLNHADNAGVKATVRLICSETSSAHMLLLDLEHLDQDPLHSGYLDELNTRLLEAGCQYLISKRSENGWEVAMQL